MNETANSLSQILGWVRMRDATAQSQICCLQHRETKSNVWNTFCMKLLYVAQQVGNAYFYRLTEIKELSGSLWWMHKGSNLLRPAVGCGLFWHVELTGVLRHKNLGSKSWSWIRVISFRYHGFPYSTIGDFLDSNIRVIRGPVCILYNIYIYSNGFYHGW